MNPIRVGKRQQGTRKMTKAVDVAAYILKKKGMMTTWKLQKLVYYCQAWSLVWDDRPLFSEDVEAWANGPVVRELYGEHKAEFEVDRLPVGNPSKLDDDGKETVDAVLDFYGDKSGAWLRELTHMECPWKDARDRARLGPGERGNEVIRKQDMAEYYEGLLEAGT